MNNIKIFSGSSNPELGKLICKHLGIEPGNVFLHQFPSSEHYIQFKENIRGEDVFLIQSANHPSNENLMQLLVMIDAAKRASADRITVVIPSNFFYGRQDKKDKPRTAISAKLVANLITSAGANRILGMDFHSQPMTGFFDIPVDQLYATSVFIKHIQSIHKDTSQMVVVSPDEGAIKRSRLLSSLLKCGFAFHSKERTGDTTIESLGLIGNVFEKSVIMCDDLTESCGTLIEAAKRCKQHGCSSVICMVSHNCMTKVGRERLSDDKFIDRFITTNSLLFENHDKIHTLDVSLLFAEAIKRIHNSESISDLFLIS